MQWILSHVKWDPLGETREVGNEFRSSISLLQPCGGNVSSHFCFPRCCPGPTPHMIFEMRDVLVIVTKCLVEGFKGGSVLWFPVHHTRRHGSSCLWWLGARAKGSSHYGVPGTKGWVMIFKTLPPVTHFCHPTPSPKGSKASQSSTPCWRARITTRASGLTVNQTAIGGGSLSHLEEYSGTVTHSKLPLEPWKIHRLVNGSPPPPPTHSKRLCNPSI